METSKERYIPALGYKLLTPLYDPIVAFTCREKKFKQALLIQAGIKNGHQVLDLGCGTGTFAVQMKRSTPGAKVISIDGDEQILEIARSKSRKAGVKVEFHRCDASQLPFDNNRFDRVVSSLFFHHLIMDQKIAAIKEVFRVLKPRGELHIADWGKPTSRMMRLLFYFIQMLDGFEGTKDNVQGLLPAVLKNYGFKQPTIRDTIPTVFGTMTLYSAVKPKQNPR
jgi:ubiquinone/menaquinone biosynthesis C-methylase UbiE